MHNELINLHWQTKAVDRLNSNLITVLSGVVTGKCSSEFAKEYMTDMQNGLDYGLPAMFFYVDNENGARAIFLN